MCVTKVGRSGDVQVSSRPHALVKLIRGSYAPLNKPCQKPSKEGLGHLKSKLVRFWGYMSFVFDLYLLDAFLHHHQRVLGVAHLPRPRITSASRALSLGAGVTSPHATTQTLPISPPGAAQPLCLDPPNLLFPQSVRAAARSTTEAASHLHAERCGLLGRLVRVARRLGASLGHQRALLGASLQRVGHLALVLGEARVGQLLPRRPAHHHQSGGEEVRLPS
jgi:hypothetical protein